MIMFNNIFSDKYLGKKSYVSSLLNIVVFNSFKLKIIFLQQFPNLI